MEKFDYSIYKETRIYLVLYDSYIKKQGISKEVLFDKLCINNSSYRRARDYEQNVGRQIVDQLSDHYGFVVPSIELINGLEVFTNKVYKNMYYKIYTSYDEDLKYIEELLEKKSLFFPVLNLLKLFMVLNSKKSTFTMMNEYSTLYNDIKQYYSFFTKELKSIYEILNMFFDNTNDDDWDKDYENAMLYQIKASKCHTYKKYIEAIFYANIAKNILLADSNFKRFIYVNQIIMSSMLYAGNYNECYKIALKQIACLESLDIKQFELESANKLYVTSLLGMERYKEIIDLLMDIEYTNLTFIICLLVSLYKTNKNQYLAYYKENVIDNDLEKHDKDLFNSLNSYLKINNKGILNTLAKYDLMGPIIKILKKF
ncbi:MAG: hypothetical protein PHX46_02700 [Bacilli bacterium]|nr:hypothetical protein [Bacilli bacterium]